MSTWFKENCLESRTFWASAIIAFLGVMAWLIFVPKTTEAWIALGSFLVVVAGLYTGINKIGDKIEAGK